MAVPGRAPASARGWRFSRPGGQSGQAWLSHLVTSAAGWPGLEEADFCRVGGAVDEALEELGVCGPSLGWKDVLASCCWARCPKQDGPVGDGPGHEGLPVQPDPGLMADRPLAARPAWWALPSSADPSRTGRGAAPVCRGPSGAGAWEGKGGPFAACSPPPAVSGRTGHWPGPFPVGYTVCLLFWKYRKSINCWRFFEHYRAVDYWGSR